jgi:hypothetical protein
MPMTKVSEILKKIEKQHVQGVASRPRFGCLEEPTVA